MDVTLYLYDHLFAEESRPFERADSYYVKTNWEDTQYRWEDQISKAALEGQFDDELCGYCDLEAMKQMLPRRENDSGPLQTSTIGLNSTRLYVSDHVGDITINRWVSSRANRTWKSIQCNWDRCDGIAFWLAPYPDEENAYLSARTTVRDCCTIVVNLIADLGGPSKGLEFQVCPVTHGGKNFLRRFETVCQMDFEATEDDKVVKGKKELKTAMKKWPGLMAAIEEHPFWSGWQCGATIAKW